MIDNCKSRLAESRGELRSSFVRARAREGRVRHRQNLRFEYHPKRVRDRASSLRRRERTLVESVVDDEEPREPRVGESTPRVVVGSRITMKAETVASVAANSMKKGDVLGTARYAGLQAAKEAASLLPLATSLNLASIDITFELSVEAIDLLVDVENVDGLGAAMAAFSGATAAALTIYDMCKSADRTMVIGPTHLLQS